MSNYSSYIGIVGGGISGLTAGCTLLEQGHKAVIFERSKQLNEHGAGISVSPNAIRILDKLDLKNKFIETSFSPKKFIFHYKNKKIGEINGDKEFITSTRQNLLQILYDRYIKLGGEILFNHDFKDLDQNKVQLNFKNNLRYKVKHVLGCDGIKSPIREEYFPNSGEPVYSGYHAWRATGTGELADGKFHLGNGKHIVFYPANEKGEISMTAVVKNKDSINDSWRSLGSKVEMLKDFKTFDQEIFSMIDSSKDIYKWGIYTRPPLNSIYIKNITLLGDAAHPMVPFLGQGGCMAIEDGYTFGMLVGKYQGNLRIVQQHYEKIRLKRTNKIQAQSLLQGKIYHLTNPVIVFFRNMFIRHTSVAKTNMKKIWNYDVDAEIKKLDKA